MGKPKISIILPAYNAEKYISRSLDSIIAQTYQDFEIIIINDGSTDKTLEICQSYQRKDPRIRIHDKKENEGLTAARRTGLGLISGEYSIQLDSDDYVDNELLKEMVEKAEEEHADIIFSDYYETHDGIDTYISQNMGTEDPLLLIQKNIEGKLMGFLWNKLIKSDLYFNNHINFDKENASEDSLAFTKLLLKCQKVVYLPKAYCHYVFYGNSLSRMVDKRNFERRLEYLRELYEVLNTNNLLQQKSFKTAFTNLKYRNLTRALHSSLYTASELRSFFPSLLRLDRIAISKMKFTNKILLSILTLRFDFILKDIFKLTK